MRLRGTRRPFFQRTLFHAGSRSIFQNTRKIRTDFIQEWVRKWERRWRNAAPPGSIKQYMIDFRKRKAFFLAESTKRHNFHGEQFLRVTQKLASGIFFFF